MKPYLACVALAATAIPAAAEQVFNENVIVNGSLCAGGECAPGEVFADESLKVKKFAARILLDDASNTGQHDWQLRANETGSNGDSLFAIDDITAGTTPFTLFGGAPDNSLYIDEDGQGGLGTSLPTASLHLIEGDGAPARIRMEETLGSPTSWDLVSFNTIFYLRDQIGNTTPVMIESRAPSQSLRIREDGNIGLGTGNPQAPLELSRDETFNFFRITATQAAVNESVDITFTGGPLGTGELRYNIVDGDGPEMKLNANGDMEIDGTLTTGGPTCAGGCDAVFDAGFARLSVKEHAALMWENGHLPAVGPTLPGAPMNLSEKMGAMLNELEHAHIYIEQLHDDRDAAQVRIAGLEARLARVEALLAAAAD